MKHITDADLIDYLNDEINDDARDARIHAHLAACHDCNARYDAEAAVGEILRASALAEEREFPSIIKAQVWAAIRNAEPTPLERLRAIISPAVAVPLAAVMALLMYFAVPVIRGEHATSSPTVAAAYYFEEHAAEALENPLADHVNTNATLALGSSATSAGAPLIDAADAATLDDVAASRE
jgi:predicted anti-sigma-YlaC factor YlaD